MNKSEVLFVATHPILALRTIRRQGMVGLDHESPPPGSTIEGFPDLPLVVAMRLVAGIETPVEEVKVILPEIVWSDADKERMKKGEFPKAQPLHFND